MKEERIKEQIDTRLLRLKFTPYEVGQARPHLRKATHKKRALAAVAAVLCLTVLTGLVTVAGPAVQRALHSRKDINDHPVQISSQDDGIQITGTDFEDLTTRFRLNLDFTDLQGDRIDSNTFFGNIEVYAQRGGVSTILGCSYSHDHTGPDPSRILLEAEWDCQEGDRIVVKLESLEQHYGGGWDTEMTLEEIQQQEPQTIQIPVSELANDKEDQAMLAHQADENGMITMLATGGRIAQRRGDDHGYLSNIGVIDGQLHIQLHYPRTEETNRFNSFAFVADNFLQERMYLDEKKDPDGNRIYYRLEQNGLTEELVCDLSEETLQRFLSAVAGDASKLILQASEPETNTVYPVSNGKWELVIPVGSGE